MYCAIFEREEEIDNTVQIPTNHGSVGYVEYIKGGKYAMHLIDCRSNYYLFQMIEKQRNQILHKASQNLLRWMIIVLGQSIVSIWGLKGKENKGSVHTIQYQLV